MKARMAALLIGLAVLPVDGQAASEASRSMRRLAAALLRDYKGRASAQSPRSSPTLAVLDFNCAPELARRRVGTAIADLLLPHIARGREFTVVERAAIDRILSEARLQRTGAIDSRTAASLGRMLSAEFVMIGSADRVGSSYEVTARIVSVETGAIAAAAYEELDAALFEQAAAPLLVLAPEKQGIGLYFLYNLMPGGRAAPASSYDVGQFRGVLAPQNIAMSSMGLGLRYFPAASVTVDVSGAVSVSQSRGGRLTEDYVGTGNYRSEVNMRLPAGFTGRANLLWAYRLGGAFRTFLGGGVALFHFQDDKASLRAKGLSPSVRGGIELSVQRRLSVGLFANYDVARVPVRAARWSVDREIGSLGGLSIEPTVSLYF